MGGHLWQLANGQDDRTVVPDREAKSISTETPLVMTSMIGMFYAACLLDLTDHLASRLRQAGVLARTIEVKIRSSDFRTQTRAQSLSEPTDVTDHLWKIAAELFERTLNPRPNACPSTWRRCQQIGLWRGDPRRPV